MTKIKTPGGGHHPPRHNHSNASNNHLTKVKTNPMDHVKIKRVKRNKKKITTKEKILAGLGVGGSLMGGLGAVSAKPSQTKFVSVQKQDDGNSAGSKIKNTLKNIFGATLGAQEAKADDSTPSEYDTRNTAGYEEVYYQGQWIAANGQTKDGSEVGQEAGFSYGSNGGGWILLDGQQKNENGTHYVSSGGSWVEAPSDTKLPQEGDEITDSDGLHRFTNQRWTLIQPVAPPVTHDPYTDDAGGWTWDNAAGAYALTSPVAPPARTGTTTPAPVIPPARDPIPQPVVPDEQPAPGTVLTLDNASSTTYDSSLNDQLTAIGATLANNITSGQVEAINGDSVSAFALSWGGTHTAGEIKTVGDQTYKFDGSTWYLQHTQAPPVVKPSPTTTTLTLNNINSGTYDSSMDSQLIALQPQIIANLSNYQNVTPGSPLAFMLGLGNGTNSDGQPLSAGTVVTASDGVTQYAYVNGHFLISAVNTNVAPALTVNNINTIQYNGSISTDTQIEGLRNMMSPAQIAALQAQGVQPGSVLAYMLGLGNSTTSTAPVTGTDGKTYTLFNGKWVLQSASGSTSLTLSNINSVSFDGSQAMIDQLTSMQGQIIGNLQNYLNVTPGSALAYMLGLGTGSGLSVGGTVTSSDGKTSYIYSTDSSGNPVFKLGAPKGYTPLSLSNINSTQYDGSVLTDTQIDQLRSTMTPAQIAALQAQGVQPGSVLAYMLGLGNSTTSTAPVTGTDGKTYKLVNGVWTVQDTNPPGASLTNRVDTTGGRSVHQTSSDGGKTWVDAPQDGDTDASGKVYNVVDGVGGWTTTVTLGNNNSQGALGTVVSAPAADGSFTITFTDGKHDPIKVTSMAQLNGLIASFNTSDASDQQMAGTLANIYNNINRQQYAAAHPIEVTAFNPVFTFENGPQGSGPYGAYDLNTQYYATQDTASWLAQKYGGTIVSVNVTSDWQMFGYPTQLFIKLPDGTMVNAGQLAVAYSGGGDNAQTRDLKAQQFIQGETAAHPGKLASGTVVATVPTVTPTGLGGSAATPTAPAAPTVSYSTNGYDSKNPKVGDTWSIIVTGKAGDTVYASDATDKNTPMGVIGANGQLVLTGTFSTQNLSSGKAAVWNETWKVGDAPAGQVQFTLNALSVTSATVPAQTGTGSTATFAAAITQKADGTFTVTLSDGTSVSAGTLAEFGQKIQQYNNATDQKKFSSFSTAYYAIEKQNTPPPVVVGSGNPTVSTNAGGTLTFSNNLAGSGLGVGNSWVVNVQGAAKNAPVYAYGGIVGGSQGWIYLGTTDANGNLNKPGPLLGNGDVGTWDVQIKVGASNSAVSTNPANTVQVGTDLKFAVGSSQITTQGTYNPTFQQGVQGDGVYGKYNLNSAYYATQDTANWLAQKYGGTVVSVNVTADWQMFSYPNQLFIRFPDGTSVNAGQMATWYASGGSAVNSATGVLLGDQRVQDFLQGEKSIHAGTSGVGSSGTGTGTAGAASGTLPAGFLMPPGGFPAGTAFGNGLYAGAAGTVVNSSGQVVATYNATTGGAVTSGTTGTTGSTVTSINTTTLPDATVGVAYGQRISASNLSSGATWTVTGLPAGLTFNPSTLIISGTPTAATSAAGAIVVVKVVSGGQTITQTLRLNVRPASASTNPGGSATPSLSLSGSMLTANNTLALQTGQTATVSASVLVYDVVSVDFITTSSNPAVATAIQDQNAGTIAIKGIAAGTATVTVHPIASGTGTAQDKIITVTVTDAAVAAVVTISTTNLSGGTVGTAYSQAVSATNLASGAVWSASGLPAGLTMNSATGVISGTPATATSSAGAGVTVTVISGSQTVTKTFNLVVVPAAGNTAAPTIAGITPGSVMVGQTVTVTVAGQNLSGATLTANNSSGLTISNVQINSAGTQLTAAIAASSLAPTGTDTLTLTTTNGSVNTGFNVTANSSTYSLSLAQSSLNMTVGQSAAILATVTTPTGLSSPLVSAGSSNTSVATVSADAATGIVTIIASGAGTATVTVHPTGMGSDTSQDKTITVTVTAANTGGGGGGGGGVGVSQYFINSYLPNGIVGVVYNGVMQSSSASGVTYRIIGGTLPPGLVLNNDGSVTGIPSAAGLYVFTVQAAASQGTTSSQQFIISILASGGTSSYYNNGGGQVAGAQVFQGLQMPPGYTASNGFAGLQMQYGNDLSARYANVNGTIYDKTTGHGFATPQEFFNASGVSSFDGLVFDTNWQPGVQVAGAATSSYTVKKGDTLFSIAQKSYGKANGKQWRKILSANPNCLKTPGNTKTLKIGAVLTIPQL